MFRYFLRPHKAFDPEAAARFGMDCSQPLLAAPASEHRLLPPRLKVSSERVVVAGLKPTDDGRGWLVRLFDASGQAQQVKLAWSEPVPAKLSLSDTSEKAGAAVTGSVEVPAWGIVTLRAE